MPTAADRLGVLYEVNRRLGTFTDLGELLRWATGRTRELLDAEGCAILLLDADAQELYFPIASQRAGRRDSEARLAEIRFPADRGIAGWVLQNGESASVEDASQDPRFYAGVDHQTTMTTRRLLCSPLRTAAGVIGVIEVVNPTRPLVPEDTVFLEALAADVALAHERVALAEGLRAEVRGLRRAITIAGVGFVVLGLVVGGLAVLAHLAWALPLVELLRRPGIWFGVGCVGAGLVLLRLGSAPSAATGPTAGRSRSPSR
jgi:GAF domain-containing protein